MPEKVTWEEKVVETGYTKGERSIARSKCEYIGIG